MKCSPARSPLQAVDLEIANGELKLEAGKSEIRIGLNTESGSQCSIKHNLNNECKSLRKIQVMFFRIIFKFSLDLRYAENGDSDQLLCIHLPDYTSAEVGPVMSLLYYGEVWLCDTYIGIYEVTIIVYMS